VLRQCRPNWGGDEEDGHQNREHAPFKPIDTPPHRVAVPPEHPRPAQALNRCGLDRHAMQFRPYWL